MKLNIISPNYKKSFNIAWLEVNTSIGNFIIQKGHAPTVLILEPNKNLNYFLLNGKKESIIPKTGIVEITRNSATLLLNE